jgi:uroporphyrinogen decarboxylase
MGSELTGIERVSRFLRRKSMDRTPVFDHVNEDPYRRWRQEGKLPEGDVGMHFGFDIRETSGVWAMADLDFKEQIIREDADTVTTLDGNGATFTRHKTNGGAPYAVDFEIRTRRDWEERTKPHLLNLDPRRIGAHWYGEEKAKAAKNGEFFTITDHFVFDRLHAVIGYKGLLLAMHDDPEWVKDMAETYCSLNICHLEELIAQAGKPDGFCIYEDMGFIGHPFLSPQMYREFFLPVQKRFISWAHGRGCPVIIHSSGNVENLLPHMLETGLDCLQTIHAKAGMHLLKLYKQYGNRLSFLGGIDARILATNDRNAIDAELKRVIPAVMQGNGYCLHSDFCVPAQMEYDCFTYFLERGRELGRY